MDPSQFDRLCALSSTQFSLFSVGQAAALGVTLRALRHAVERGYIDRYRRGVYAVRGHQSSRWQAVMAAWLAAGPKAVVSHSSAAAIHGFHGILIGVPELTVPDPSRVSLKDVRIHRSTDLGSEDVYTKHNLALTKPIRTVIDMAARLSEQQLAKVLDEGSINHLWTAEGVVRRVNQLIAPGRSSMKTLQRLLAERIDEGNPATKLEQRVIRVLKGHVPPFVVHYHITLEGTDIEMDIAWPEHKVDGEVEGRWVRATSKTKFDRDKRRANLLAAYGWRLVYFTSEMSDKTILAEARRAVPS